MGGEALSLILTTAGINKKTWGKTFHFGTDEKFLRDEKSSVIKTFRASASLIQTALNCRNSKEAEFWAECQEVKWKLLFALSAEIVEDIFQQITLHYGLNANILLLVSFSSPSRPFHLRQENENYLLE